MLKTMQEAVHTIRESNRTLLNINRRKLRDEEKDVHRSLTNFSISTEDVTNIALKLRTKLPITAKELFSLKNALINDEKNIEIVLKTNGALHGLVRELSGHNEMKQYEAAGCCCNLALADSKAGVAVAKAAGPYLIAALSNLSIEIIVSDELGRFQLTCTWTLGNLSGSGIKASTLLIAQGALGKLIQQLSAPNQSLRDAAVEALTHFTYQMADNLSSSHYQAIILNIQQLPINLDTLRLLFILTCHKDFTGSLLNTAYLEKILEDFSSVIKAFDDENIDRLLYLIRIFANLRNEITYEMILNFFVSNNMYNCVRRLLRVQELSENLLWLMGNMYSLCGTHEFFVNFL